MPRAEACASWKAVRSRFCAGGGGAGRRPGGDGCLGGVLATAGVAPACWAVTTFRFMPTA